LIGPPWNMTPMLPFPNSYDSNGHGERPLPDAA
jgi:hypothetical protein